MWNTLDRFNISLGRWFNVPVTLHWSFVLVTALYFFMSPSYAALLIAVFFIVLLHEFGHCLMAKYFNWDVHSIVLYPIGGIASISFNANPKEEFWITLGGPAVNAILILPLYFLGFLSPFFVNLAFCNYVILVFNLVPAYPMDGGRVLKSILWMRWKDRYDATMVAARVGQIFAFIFVAAGFFMGMLGLAVVGFFVYMAAEHEVERMKQRFRNIRQDTPQRTETPITTEVGNPDVRESSVMLRDMDHMSIRRERNRPD